MPLLPGCPYVFWHPKSQTRWHNVRKVFNKAREDANLDWLIIKDLRRHYGIVLSENGAEMHVIQAMLGHSSVTITQEHYAHFSPPMSSSTIITIYSDNIPFIRIELHVTF